MAANNKFKIVITFVIVTFLFCLTNTHAEQRAIDPDIQKQIDEFVQNVFFPYARINGLALSIVKDNGEVLYNTGYGLADQEKGIPIRNNTQFLIGSVTKSLTSMLAVKVLSENFPNMGEAVLDTPIRKLMPQANFTLLDRFRSEYATFRDLLAHRLCIFRHDFLLSVVPFENREEITFRERYAEEICGVRTEFQYNNQMYLIAAELIAKIANQSYEELAQDLFAQIGMVESNMTSTSDDFSKMPNRAQPYYVMDGDIHPINTELVKRVAHYNAAGGLFMSPNDAAKYLQFGLNKGKVGDKQIISEEAMGWLVKMSMMMPNAAYKSSEQDLLLSRPGYGLGLMLGAYDGWEMIEHGGYFPPYHTQLSMLPEFNIGIFTSSNQDPLWADQLIVHAFIVEIFRGSGNATMKALKLWKQLDAKVQEDKRKKVESMENFLNEIKVSDVKQTADDIVGKYGSGVGGELEIYEKFNEETNATGLYFSYGKWGKGWLEFIGQSSYQLTWDTDIIQDYYAGGDKEGLMVVTVINGTLGIYVPSSDGMWLMGKYQFGLSLSDLPLIPWNPDSCGPSS